MLFRSWREREGSFLLVVPLFRSRDNFLLPPASLTLQMKSLLAIFPAGHFPFASPPDLRPIFFLALYPKDDHYGLWAAPRSPLSSGSYSVLPIESTSSQKMERETCCIFLSLLPPYFMTIAPARKLRSLALIGLCWHYFPAPLSLWSSGW